MISKVAWQADVCEAIPGCRELEGRFSRYINPPLSSDPRLLAKESWEVNQEAARQRLLLGKLPGVRL